MNLEQQVMNDLKDAMRAKDEAALRGLRAIKAALLLLKTSGSTEITENDELKMLQKLVKQRKDSLTIYQEQKRTDLAQKELEELEIIEKFLPQPLSLDDLKMEVQKIIINSGASSIADLGKVMGLANKQLAGKADGKTISEVVKELLK